MHLISAIALVAVLLNSKDFAFAKSNIKINNNGYEDIVIAFHPDTPEKEGLPLISKIEDLIKNGSKALFEGTQKRAYIRKVNILVPKTWNSRTFTRATFENFFAADIRIDNPNPRYGDGPYTMQPSGCGQAGLYVHFTPNYLKNLHENSTTIFGDPGKTFAHEWAHLRYGIFDEFGLYKVPQFPLSYYDSFHGELMPNSCSDEKLNGIYWDPVNNNPCNFVNGFPDENCFFQPDMKNNNASTSLASYHFLPSVHLFCDEKTHNIRAPNKQNLMCNYTSTWEIILNNDDFTENKNPPIAEMPENKPEFTIVQQMEDTFSVVIDVSGSMDTAVGGYSRLKMATDTIKRWLTEEVKEESAVGIIWFSDKTNYMGSMLKITNDTVRTQLINELPPNAVGGTCIGCGLQSSLQQLKTYRKTTGGVTILLTDGEENAKPFIKDVQDKIKEAGVRVNTIAFTKSASDKLSMLANITGGKAYFVEEGDVQGLGSAFFDAVTYQTADFDVSVKIAENFYQPTAQETIINGSFVIDETIGNSTIANFQYFVANDITDIKIVGPELNASLSDGNQTDDKLGQNIQFRFDLLKPGKYDYTIERNGIINQKITVTVTSKSAVDGVKPITTRCWAELGQLNNKKVILIFAEVTQGNNPVINAAVIAQVQPPESKSVMVQLLDVGNGAPDITKNDGIYSGYFKKFNKKGNYVVKAQVAGDGETSIQEMGFHASQSMPIVNNYMANINVSSKPTGSFERSVAGGTIQLDKEVPIDPNPDPINQILDLRAVNLSIIDSTVTLQWTAPGDDDQNVITYKLLYSTNWDELHENFTGNLSDTYINPSSPGKPEQAVVHIPEAQLLTNYYFAIQATGNLNTTSPVSNIASIIFKPSVKNLIVGTTEDSTISPTSNSTEVTENETDGLSPGAIAGIVVVVILVIVGASVGLFYLVRKRKRSNIA